MPALISGEALAEEISWFGINRAPVINTVSKEGSRKGGGPKNKAVTNAVQDPGHN
ncbi:hypothetical protein AwEntero_21640 [Enterobacterales bacterium]|nr:hypothetical protein AwEntero_21640 [Enterobacterales bacterium]